MIATPGEEATGNIEVSKGGKGLGGEEESMSSLPSQCAVALIASLRPPLALRINNQLTMATWGDNNEITHAQERKGGGHMCKQ